MSLKNLGKPERAMRVVAGGALAYASYASYGAVAIILGVASAGAVLTGLAGFCGVYALLGAKTCSVEEP